MLINSRSHLCAMHHIRRLSLLMMAGAALGVHAAAAAPISPSDLPSSSDPARILSAPQTTTPDFEKLRTPSARPQSVAAAPAGAETVKFVLRSVTVDGVTAYTPNEMRELYESYEGQVISMADVFILASKIQQKYFNDGYSFARVIMPKQNIKNGAVSLAVIEGGVATVTADNIDTSSPLIKDALNQIKSMRPLNVLKLERLLLTLNNFVDGDVVSVISGLADDPSARAAGMIKITLVQQNKKPIDGMIGLNNHGSIFSGPFQVESSLGYIHAPWNYTKASVSMAAAIPFNDMKNFGVNIRTPVFGASGAAVNLGYTRGWTEAGSSLDIFDIVGATETLSLGISYPFWRQRDGEWMGTAQFDAKNTDSNFLSTRLYRDRLRIVTLGTNFTQSDNWSGVNFANADISHGLDILGSRETGSTDLSREEGHTNFTKIEGQIGRLQSLPAGFEAYANVAFQWTNVPLLSSEEFGFGGATRGRGYASSEITGDRGIGGTVEFRKNIAAPQLNLAFQPYVFFDAGKVKNLDSTNRNIESATSTGLGARIYAPNGLSGEITIAKPLARKVENPLHYTSDHGLQVGFSVQKSF